MALPPIRGAPFPLADASVPEGAALLSVLVLEACGRVGATEKPLVVGRGMLPPVLLPVGRPVVLAPPTGGRPLLLLLPPAGGVESGVLALALS